MKLRKLILILLTLLLLTGCGDTSPDETTLPSLPETTAPAVSTPEITEGTLPQAGELEAVNILSNQKFKESPSVAILSERVAAFLTSEYLPSQGIAVSHLMVLDLYSDTVLAEATMEKTFSLPAQSHLPGVLPLFDQTSDRCIILDRNLQTLREFSCPERNGIFSPDLSSYYFISAQRICKMDIATGEWSVVETELTLPVESIRDYDPEENILLVDVHTQYYLTELCVGAVDLDTGELLLLTDTPKGGVFSSDGVLLEQQELVTNSDVIRIRWADSQVYQLTDVLPCSDVVSSRYVPFSDYLITLRYDPGNAYNLSSFVLYRFREGYESCELYELTDGVEPDKLLSLPDGNLLAVDYNRRRTRIVLICPDQLTFTGLSDPESVDYTLVDSAIPESYAEQSAYVEVPEELRAVREQADKLEEVYDITILMSNQCDSIIEQCGFTLQPTDQADLANEAKLLRSALKDLEDSLALYPENFFTQFRNSAHERGILVLLVENITTGLDDDNVDILGVTYDMGDWYPISVDITTSDLPSTYCHEIWHAMENKIMDTNPSLLNDVYWGWNNPDGFSYKGVVEGYYNDTADTYVGGNCGKDSYFVDSYAKTLPQEDRARLMEYVMTSEWDGKYMMEAPVLHEKMKIMIEAVRGVFDTTGWEDVRWERFHP